MRLTVLLYFFFQDRFQKMPIPSWRKTGNVKKWNGKNSRKNSNQSLSTMVQIQGDYLRIKNRLIYHRIKDRDATFLNFPTFNCENIQKIE